MRTSRSSSPTCGAWATGSADRRTPYLAFQEASKRLQVGGRIVAISTALTRNPMANLVAYSASKAALEGLEGLARSFAHEVGPRQITVNAVLPGPTETEGLAAPRELVDELVRSTPLRRVGRPKDIADVVAFRVSADARWVTGQAIVATGGLDRS